MFTQEMISRAISKIYDPPIRGLHSKKGRIRKKAQAKLKGTIRVLAFNQNPLLGRVEKSNETHFYHKRLLHL